MTATCSLFYGKILIFGDSEEIQRVSFLVQLNDKKPEMIDTISDFNISEKELLKKVDFDEGFKYEISSCGDLIHFELYLKDNEVVTCNMMLDLM